jgi:RNase P subunit RPR2
MHKLPFKEIEVKSEDFLIVDSETFYLYANYEYMMIGVGKCSGCGQQKRLWYEITIGEKTKNKYCKKCYQNLYSKIKCRFCGEEMIKDYYYKHLSEIHPQ